VKKYFKFSAILIGLLVVAFCGCKKKKAVKDEQNNSQGHYFSISQFALDEWNTFAGEPFVIVKTVRINDGKTDSSYTNSDTINWAPIIHTFLETDISNPKFDGKYKVSHFEDNNDGTFNLFYETEDEDLFTQKLLITVDQFTRKVQGIYVETIKNTAWSEQIQKLYYSPLKTIQIITDDRPRLGKKKLSVVQYDFGR
jgi:hypothetical protein